jgi:hypothetical protein
MLETGAVKLTDRSVWLDYASRSLMSSSQMEHSLGNGTLGIVPK